MNLSFKKYGQGTPLLIFHGLFGSGDNWTTHAKKWAEHGFCVYTIDQRNHGHSAHSNEMNYQLMADDAENLIASEGLRDIIFLGTVWVEKLVYTWLNAFLLLFLKW